MLLFLPPRVQAIIGVAIIATGLGLHSYIVAGLGAVGLAIGAGRWVQASRHKSELQR
jgi:hypothetical protein